MKWISVALCAALGSVAIAVPSRAQWKRPDSVGINPVGALTAAIRNQVEDVEEILRVRAVDDSTMAIVADAGHGSGWSRRVFVILRNAQVRPRVVWFALEYNGVPLGVHAMERSYSVSGELRFCSPHRLLYRSSVTGDVRNARDILSRDPAVKDTGIYDWHNQSGTFELVSAPSDSLRC